MLARREGGMLKGGRGGDKIWSGGRKANPRRGERRSFLTKDDALCLEGETERHKREE